jgi:hypothetical protein
MIVAGREVVRQRRERQLAPPLYFVVFGLPRVPSSLVLHGMKFNRNKKGK